MLIQILPLTIHIKVFRNFPWDFENNAKHYINIGFRFFIGQLSKYNYQQYREMGPTDQSIAYVGGH